MDFGRIFLLLSATRDLKKFGTVKVYYVSYPFFVNYVVSTRRFSPDSPYFIVPYLDDAYNFDLILDDCRIRYEKEFHNVYHVPAEVWHRAEYVLFSYNVALGFPYGPDNIVIAVRSSDKYDLQAHLDIQRKYLLSLGHHWY